MTGAEPLFIDTNILIYANAAAAPLHDQALKMIKDAYQNGCPLWISRQVLREFITVRTRPPCRLMKFLVCSPTTLRILSGSGR